MPVNRKQCRRPIDKLMEGQTIRLIDIVVVKSRALPPRRTRKESPFGFTWVRKRPICRESATKALSPLRLWLSFHIFFKRAERDNRNGISSEDDVILWLFLLYSWFLWWWLSKDISHLHLANGRTPFVYDLVFVRTAVCWCALMYSYIPLQRILSDYKVLFT